MYRIIAYLEIGVQYINLGIYIGTCLSFQIQVLEVSIESDMTVDTSG